MRRNAGKAGLVAALLLLLTACNEQANAQTSPPAAATEGRACQLVEYGPVASVLGVTFDTAGGAHKDDTYTCVLERSGSPYPDLTLAVTATTVDELFFRATVVPNGAATLPALGRVAYQTPLPPVTADDGTPSGGGLEVGWLSAHAKLMFLRYTFPGGVTPDQVAAFTPLLVTLAKQIEAQLGTVPLS